MQYTFYLVVKDTFAVARENGGGYFIDLLWASGLANEMLQSGAEYTLVVPADTCFKTLPKTLRNKMANNCFLRSLLSFHISKKEKTSTAVGSPSKHLKSQSKGKHIFFSELGQVRLYGNDGSFERFPSFSTNAHWS